MIKKLIRFYVFSNIHISLAAGFFVLSSFLISNIGIDWSYVIFIICGTFTIYNLHRFIALKKISASQWSERHMVFEHRKTLFGTLSILFILCGAISFFTLSSALKKWLVIPMTISLAYVIPSFNKQRIRDLPYLKIILIGFAWASFYTIPCLNLNLASQFIFLEKFLFFIGLTIPFDLRDSEVDKISGLKTLANSISQKGSIRIAILLLIFASLVAFFLYHLKVYSLQILGLLSLSYIVSGLLVFKSNGRRDFYYLAYLDGMIFLQGTLISIHSFFSI